MKAKNREQYIDAWQDHVNQLVHVFLAADDMTWLKVKAELYAVIDKASENDFDKHVQEVATQ